MKKPEVLFVVNKRLPPSDYRMTYALHAKKRHVVLGMPERPDSLPLGRFVRLNFGEGVSTTDFCAFLSLFLYLWSNRRHLKVVHFFSTKLVLIGPLLASIAGLPSIITITGFGRLASSGGLNSNLLGRLYKVMLKGSVSACHQILFQNHGDRSVFERWFPEFIHKSDYVGSSVEFPTNERTTYEGRPLVILMVARLMPTKGVDDFLKIAERLSGPDFKFVIVGPASVGCENLSERVRQYARRGTIEYLGELHGEAVVEAYQQAQVFLFTSRYGEGMPRVLLEAGFSGLLPIAYDINANRDLITEDRGFLLPVGDVDGVVKILGKVDEDRRLLENKASNYREFILRNYTFEVYKERLDTAIEKVVASPR